MNRQELTRHIIKCSYQNKAGHIPSALSILDIIKTLYDDILTQNDKFILSKGHGCLALYAVLWDKGYITEEQFYSFTQFDSILGGHPSSRKIPQVPISTGSLGHGLPFAVGLAMAKKIKGEPGTVYCLIGDGEANEGSIWEAIAIAHHNKLDNLVCIVDNNHSTDRALEIDGWQDAYDGPSWSLCDKFEAFKWSTRKNINYLKEKYKEFEPLAIIVDTIKGYGCKLMESKPEWHHRQPKTEEELNELLKGVY